MQLRKQIILSMFMILLGCTFSIAQAPTPTPIPQDINKDGIVDWFDLLEVRAEWYFSTRPTMTSTLTPTPTMAPEPTPTQSSEERVFSAEPGIGIPDDSPKGVTSTIQVGENLYIYRLRVGVWITHEWPDDLAVDLEGPDGTRIRLFNEDYYDIHGVFGLDYTPSGPGSLSDFIGKNARGTWKLTVRDPWDEDMGTLDRWDLRILGGQQPPPPPTATPTPSGPSYCIGDYFPLGNGLRWTYTSSYGDALAEMQSPRSFCGMPMTCLTMTMEGQSRDYYLRLANDTLYNYGIPEYAFCSSPIFYGDCTIRHGSRFPQHLEVEGVEFDFSCDWSFAGRQSVPAGTFDDCLQLTVSIDAYDPSSGEAISGTGDVWTVAPGLGRIKVAVLDQFLDIVDMAELTSSSLLGKPLSSWPGVSVQEPSSSFILATPESIFQIILRRVRSARKSMSIAQAATSTPIPQDINKDGIVDEQDLLSLKAKWHISNKPTRTPKPPTPTPTPTETPTLTATPTRTTTVLPTRTPVTGDLVVDLPGGIEMPFVLVPAGSFQMGSVDDATWSRCYPCEQPVHEVNIGYDFYMGKFEVTQAQWAAVMGPTWFASFGVGDNYPAYYITWNEAQDFVTALSDLAEGTFRLPSEAEWEYACRAGTTTRFSFGDSNCTPNGFYPGCQRCELDDYAWRWCYDSGEDADGTCPVGSKRPNAFGLYDMHGNVAEWCQDGWHDDYIGAPSDGSPWEDSATANRVVRGGNWDLSPASTLRSSARRGEYYSVYDINGYHGFRVVREAE